jgi:hypothetical protein
VLEIFFEHSIEFLMDEIAEVRFPKTPIFELLKPKELKAN